MFCVCSSRLTDNSTRLHPAQPVSVPMVLLLYDRSIPHQRQEKLYYFLAIPKTGTSESECHDEGSGGRAQRIARQKRYHSMQHRVYSGTCSLAAAAALAGSNPVLFLAVKLDHVLFYIIFIYL